MIKQHKQVLNLLLKCNNNNLIINYITHLHENNLTGSFYGDMFLLFPLLSKGKWTSTCSLNGWFVLDEKESGEIYNGSLHGNHELAWMRRKPCHHESGPSNSIQMTTSMSPCRNGSNEPVTLWMSRGEKQDMSTRERSTQKQEEHSFPPRGVVLASILCSPLHWFDSQCWSPKTQLRLMTERQLHIALCQICLEEYNFLTTLFPLTWICWREFFFPSPTQSG